MKIDVVNMDLIYLQCLRNLSANQSNGIIVILIKCIEYLSLKTHKACCAITRKLITSISLLFTAWCDGTKCNKILLSLLHTHMHIYTGTDIYSWKTFATKEKYLIPIFEESKDQANTFSKIGN